MSEWTTERIAALLEPLTGYTPGPWEWRIEETDPEWGATVALAPGILLPDGSDGTPDGDEHDKANARLIAAAPDLVDALRAVAAERAAALAEVAKLQEQMDTMREIVRLSSEAHRILPHGPTNTHPGSR